MCVAQKSLEFTGLFEAELLVELMLRFWEHPFANDREFRNDLLERTAEVLRRAIAGESIMEDVKASNTNFVAALWYVEWSSCQEIADESPDKRYRWLETVRHALPSCFCNPDDLTP